MLLEKQFCDRHFLWAGLIDMKTLGMLQTLLLAGILASLSATANSEVVTNPDLAFQEGRAALELSDLEVQAPNATQILPNGDFEMGRTV
jgi:hypothetical protein